MGGGTHMSNGNTSSLPTGYEVIRKINLAEDKRINLTIQLCFIFITAILIGFAFWARLPLSNDLNPFFSFLITIFLVLVYMALHELTHAFFIKVFSGRRPSFRIRLPFLSVGSETYYNRKSFVIIAIAPAFIGGISLILLLFLVPTQIFISFYILLIVNFAGSAGDYVQAYIAINSPANVLLQDNGKETSLFMPSDSKKDPGSN